MNRPIDPEVIARILKDERAIVRDFNAELARANVEIDRVIGRLAKPHRLHRPEPWFHDDTRDGAGLAFHIFMWGVAPLAMAMVLLGLFA